MRYIRQSYSFFALFPIYSYLCTFAVWKMLLILTHYRREMETVENKFITVSYKLYTIEDGEKEFAEEVTAEKPYQFISGLGTTVEAFEEAVLNMEKGESFDVTIPCEKAFGEASDEQIFEIEKTTFHVDGKFDEEHIREGNVITVNTSVGPRYATVEKVTDDKVTLDLNHPYAGADLQFVGTILENRPATNKELEAIAQQMSGGGCSCGCDSCGGDCESGCDGGCGGHCE